MSMYIIACSSTFALLWGQFQVDELSLQRPLPLSCSALSHSDAYIHQGRKPFTSLARDAVHIHSKTSQEGTSPLNPLFKSRIMVSQ